MPRLDHIKGEVSVRNLVWRQESNSALVEKWAQTAPLPQPYQSWMLRTKDFVSPNVHIPGNWGWGGGRSSGQKRKAAVKQLLGESSPSPPLPLPCHIKAEAQVKNGVADSCSSEKKGVRGCSL